MMKAVIFVLFFIYATPVLAIVQASCMSIIRKNIMWRMSRRRGGISPSLERQDRNRGLRSTENVG